MLCCTKKKITSDNSLLGLEYYPTTIGHYLVYDVDSVIYVQLPKKDTITYKYRVKEKLAGTFTDNQGREAIRLERYIKKYNPAKSYDSIPWSIKEVWMVNADNKSVQVVESNIRFVKLIFPVQEKVSWNGNSTNTMEEWQYSYDYIDHTEMVNKTKFDKVLMVKQKYYAPLISLQSYLEKYAKGTGLIYREIIDVRSNTIVSGVAVIDRIESGLIYKQSFVSSGYE